MDDDAGAFWARVGAVPLIGPIAAMIALARIVVELLYSTNALRPVLVGILLILAVFAVLVPTRIVLRQRPEAAAP